MNNPPVPQKAIKGSEGRINDKTRQCWENSAFITEWPALHWLLSYRNISIVSHFWQQGLCFHTRARAQETWSTSTLYLEVTRENKSVDICGRHRLLAEVIQAGLTHNTFQRLLFFLVTVVAPVCASWNTFTEQRYESYIQPSSVIRACCQQGFPCRGVGDWPHFVWTGTSLF